MVKRFFWADYSNYIKTNPINIDILNMYVKSINVDVEDADDQVGFDIIVEN